MALAFYGNLVSEQDILAQIGNGNDPNSNWVDGYGVHIEPIAGYINKFRETEIKTNWSIAGITDAVSQGYPVILWVYNRYSQPAGPFQLASGEVGYMGMHSEVVRGFIGPKDNPEYILTNDPWRGQLTYSRATFESIWRYIGNTALVVK